MASWCLLLVVAFVLLLLLILGVVDDDSRSWLINPQHVLSWVLWTVPCVEKKLVAGWLVFGCVCRSHTRIFVGWWGERNRALAFG
jgi:hypothetical protein